MANIRPIDANALFDALYDNEFQTFCPLDEVSDVIAAAPTLDYAPVVHGEWKYYRKQNRAVCMACSFERDLDADFGRAIACPNCGAKMDGGKEHE